MNQISLTHAGCREALSKVFLQTFRLSWLTCSQVTTGQQMQTSCKDIRVRSYLPLNNGSDRHPDLLTTENYSRCLWTNKALALIQSSSPGSTHFQLIPQDDWIQSKKKKERLDILWTLKDKFQCQVLVNFWRRAMDHNLTRNVTNWHGSSRPGTGRLYSRWLKPPEHHWYQLQSISEVRHLHRVQRY